MPCLERGFVFQCFSLVQVFCYYNDYCYSSHVSHVRVWGGEEGQIVPEGVLELVGEFVLWDIVEDIVSLVLRSQGSIRVRSVSGDYPPRSLGGGGRVSLRCLPGGRRLLSLLRLQGMVGWRRLGLPLLSLRNEDRERGLTEKGTGSWLLNYPLACSHRRGEGDVRDKVWKPYLFRLLLLWVRHTAPP